MIDGSPSRTALMVAALRADHFLNAPEPKILRDSLAMQLGGFVSTVQLDQFIEATIAAFTALSDRQTAELFTLNIAHSVCMRSRLVEGELEQASDLKQFVVLGAGLDSTAYRQPELTQGLEIFEVDHPATQKWKKERLADLDIPLPPNLRFVSFDFEHQTLESALSAGGVDVNAKTLFSWLGVQPYLTPATVKETLKVLAGFAEGSKLVMDFVMPDHAFDKQELADNLAHLNSVVAEMGEPFLSLNTEQELDQILRDAGYSQIDFYSSKALTDRFLDGNENANAIPNDAVSLLAATI